MASKKTNQQTQTPPATTAPAQVQYATGIFGNTSTLNDVAGQVLNKYGTKLRADLTPIAQTKAVVITYEKMQSYQTNPNTDKSAPVTRQGVVVTVSEKDAAPVLEHLQNYDGPLNGVMYRVAEQHARTQ